MEKTVFALYESLEQAVRAVEELIAHGMDRERISVIAQDAYGKHARRLGIEMVGGNFPDRSEDDEVYDAPSNDPLKKISRMMDGVCAAVLPGLGPVIATGPTAAMLRNARNSGTPGEVRALQNTGIAEDDAEALMEGIRQGRTLVMVESMDSELDGPAEILNRFGPVNLHPEEEDTGAEKWQGFQEETETFAFDESSRPYKERSPASTLDYGKGADDFLEGKPISDYDRRETLSDLYMGDDPDAWRRFEPVFREHFREHYQSEGGRWEDYLDAYRFGYDLANLHNSMDQEWDRLRGYARQNWVSQNPGRLWIDYQDTIHAGWEITRTPR